MPTAPVSAFAFSDTADDFSLMNNAPLRFSFVPTPIIGMTPEAMADYITIADPSTGKSVIDEIIGALTQPETVEEANYPGGTNRPKSSNPSKYLSPDTEDNLRQTFYTNGWTDGLPIILPTKERVDEMLEGSSHFREKTVGEVYIVNKSAMEVVRYTVSDVAVIAVMAGARPEHFPVILALAASKVPSILNSTSPFASMMIVNGPIREEIEMNSGKGAFSPINMSNSVIGRAWTLMTLNWYFNNPSSELISSQGNNIAFGNLCIAENEERSVWQPFHVQKGYRLNESIISIFRGWTMMSSNGGAANRRHGEEMAIQMNALSPINSAATFVIDPLVARNLKENEGFKSKESYARWLAENVSMTAGHFWKNDYVNTLMGNLARQGKQPYAKWMKLPEEAVIHPYNNPDNISFIVAGGETSPVWKALDFAYVKSVSIDQWR